MPTFNSQIIYGWGGEPEPIRIDGEDEKLEAVSTKDFLSSLGAAEDAFGQKILQDNQESERLLNLINDQGLTNLDTGTATAAQCAAAINSINAILTNLVVSGKDRG